MARHLEDSPAADFARRCHELAEERSGRDDLQFGFGQVAVFFACPRTNHEWKGTRSSAWVSMSGGTITAKCHRCTEDEKGDFHGDPAAYTADLMREAGWSEDDAAKASKAGKWLIVRHHDYGVVDGRFIYRHTKLRAARGGAVKWRHEWMPTDERGVFAHFRICGANELKAWQDANYESFGHYYNAVHLYQHQRFRQQGGALRDVYRVIACEGEKDAETCNELMTAAGAGIIATALPDQSPSSLAPHQKEILASKPLALIPDNDAGGRRFAESWSAAAWGCASSIKVYPSDAWPEDTDFTDWVEAERAKGRTDKEIADEVIATLTSTAELAEPLIKPSGWKQKLRTTQKGGVSSTNLYNGEVAWTQHPDLAGKVKLNVLTGEHEVDAPWGQMMGARRIGEACCAWLDREHGVALAAKTLETALGLPGVAAPYNPCADLLTAEVWDGEPRLDALLTRYLPLNVSQAQAIVLARVVVGDLVAKLRGDMHSQRMLLAVETHRDFDVASALAVVHGARHSGRIRDLVDFSRRGAGVVQLDMGAVMHRNVAPANAASVFGAYAWHAATTARLPSAWFIAVGPRPEDKASVLDTHERVVSLALSGEPRVGELALDAPQILAEGLVRLDELLATDLLPKSELQTIDEEARKEAAATMIRALVLFASKDLPLDRVAGPDEIQRAPFLAEPRRHIIEEQLFTVMRAVLMDEWVRPSDWRRALSNARRIFKLPNGVLLTEKIARSLGLVLNLDGKQRYYRGTYLRAEKFTEMQNWLLFREDDEERADFRDIEAPKSPESLGKGCKEGTPWDIEEVSAEEPLLNALSTRAHARNMLDSIFAGEINGAWEIKIGGEPVDPAALAEQLVADNLLGDALVLRSPTPVELMRWLDEVGLLDAVEVEAIDPAGEVGEDGRKPGR